MKVIKAIAILLSACLICQARPVRRTSVKLFQPDGYSFYASISGDEFIKLVATEDGCAIKQDPDGWWCYAWYDSEGVKHCTPDRVAENSTGSAISRNIPYGKLSAKAAARRMTAPENNAPEVITKATSKQRKGIVLLVQFKDIKFTYGRERFVNMLSQDGYSRDGATGSAKEYFKDQFGAGWEFQFDVSQIITLDEDRAYYGKNSEDGHDQNPEKMVEQACIKADSAIDFSMYDCNSDGKADNIFLFFAGADEADGAEEECIWSHAWYLKSGAGINLTLDGVRIDRYACASELSKQYNGKYAFTGIGTFCHEYSHTFGLPDLYDTDYADDSGLMSAGLWYYTSLMDGGNNNNQSNTPPNFNAIEREILGLGSCEVLKEGEYVLEPVSENGRYLKMETDSPGEYFLFECRKAAGWDKYIGGDGLLIYHIDKSSNMSGRSSTLETNVVASQRWSEGLNEVNANPEHQCADLIEADSRSDRVRKDNFAESIYGVFFPHGSTTSFSFNGKPPFKFWNGNASELGLGDIRRIDGGRISFTVRNITDMTPMKAIMSPCSIFQDAAIISWQSDRISETSATISWGTSDGSKTTLEVEPYSPGCYSITFEGLQPRTSYSCEIYFCSNGVQGQKTAYNFTTKSSTDGLPYIYLKGIERNPDGSFPIGSQFPLRVFNANGTPYLWTYDGKAVECSGNGYFCPQTSGTLCAELIYENGTREYIFKKINLK